MNPTASIVPPHPSPPDPYELELLRRMEVLLEAYAGELAKLSWWARRRRERQLKSWVESELSCLVRAGKLPPKRSKKLLQSLLGGEPPVLR